MPLSWNEIKSRAVKFSKEWEAASEESAESQTFLNEFFEVFGISRRRVATFEKPVKKIDGREGYIDLLWPGKILIEHKTKGKNLEKAKNQAIAPYQKSFHSWMIFAFYNSLCLRHIHRLSRLHMVINHSLVLRFFVPFSILSS